MDALIIRVQQHKDAIKRLENLIQNDMEYHERQISELRKQMKFICPHSEIKGYIKDNDVIMCCVKCNSVVEIIQ